MGKGKPRREAVPARDDNTLTAAEDGPSSSSSSEVEDTGRLSRAEENKFLATLLRIRQKDKGLFKKDTKVFSSSSSDDESQSGDSEPDPLYPTDAETGRREEEEDDSSVESAGSEDDEGKRMGLRIRRMKYSEDQKPGRSQFFKAAALSRDDSDGGDFGGVAQGWSLDEASSEDDPSSEEDQEEVATTKALLDDIFGRGESLTNDDPFLKDYLANQRWVDSDEEAVDVGPDPNEDEEFLEKADTHEATYNYRFEEPGAAQIVTYPRFSETSVRRTQSRRKRQRESKKQRKAEKRQQDLQGLRTQKNLKRKQIESKIQELSLAAGDGGGPTKDLLEELLMGDFDTNDWDAKMAATYNDDYYEHEDHEWARKRQKAAREVASEGRAELQNLIQDYYGLDHEDDIDGVKCRFRYVEVPKDSYGLSVEELLCLDDVDLNKFVGRRHLDAYREDAESYKVNPYKLKDIKRKVDYSQLERKGNETKGGEDENGEGDTGAADLGEYEDAPAPRLASYSRDTLQVTKRKDGDQKKKKRKLQSKGDASSSLTKAQRKNFARKRRKRVEKAQAAQAASDRG